MRKQTSSGRVNIWGLAANLSKLSLKLFRGLLGNTSGSAPGGLGDPKSVGSCLETILPLPLW